MEYRCKICNKEYSSYQSLWIHNKRYHTTDDTRCHPNSTNSAPDSTNSAPDSTILAHNSTNLVQNTILSCNYCGKIFSRKYSIKRHYNSCKEKPIKDNKDQEIILLTNALTKKESENKHIQEQLDEMKKQLLQLLEKQCKVHPKTFNKINKQLNNNNTQINDNKVINNNIIIQLGKEKLHEVFSKEEQLKVLNQGYMCLDYLVQYAHFNPKYPQFKNILITNLQNNIAYKYNLVTNNFDVVRKEELLNEIISERMYDINEFFENYKDEITIRMQKVINDFIAKMECESYEQDKMKDIKIILYNNKDKIVINKHKEIDI